MLCRKEKRMGARIAQLLLLSSFLWHAFFAFQRTHIHTFDLGQWNATCTYIYTRLPMKAYVTLFLLGVASYTVGCGSTVALVTGRVTGVCESLSSCAIILHFQMVHQTEVITVTAFLCLFVNKSNSRKFCKFRNQPQLTNRLVSNWYSVFSTFWKTQNLLFFTI